MVLLDFSMAPLGKGESVSPYVARCLEVVASSGLDYRLHAMGTTLEGELDQVSTSSAGASPRWSPAATAPDAWSRSTTPRGKPLRTEAGTRPENS